MTNTEQNHVVTVAYLLGIKADVLRSTYANSLQQITDLESNEDATIVRQLCNIRNILLQNWRKIDQAMIYGIKNIDNMDWFKDAGIENLEKKGVQIILYNVRVNNYFTHISEQINRYIEKCKYLFNEKDYLPWKYIKGLFAINGINSMDAKTLRKELSTYFENKHYYPFQLYIHWKPYNCGRMLLSDEKLKEVICKINGLGYTPPKTDNEKHNAKEALISAQDNISEFLSKNKKVTIAVDCENADVYKLYSAIKNIPEDKLKSINKILLFNDESASSGWDYLSKFTKISTENILTQRIIEHKSLVDIRMTAGVCKEFYANNTKAFIIVSSDSDYWGLISSLPEAEFLVMYESDKCSDAIKTTLSNEGICACSIDGFKAGPINEFENKILFHTLEKYLPNLFLYTGMGLVHAIYKDARIYGTNEEKKEFYEKYIKTMKLTIDENDHFKIKFSK